MNKYKTSVVLLVIGVLCMAIGFSIGGWSTKVRLQNTLVENKQPAEWSVVGKVITPDNDYYIDVEGTTDDGTLISKRWHVSEKTFMATELAEEVTIWEVLP